MWRGATFWSQPDPERRSPSENGLEHGKGFEQGQRNGQENGQGNAGTPPGLSRSRLETETTTYLWDGLRVLAEYTDKGAPLAEYYTAGDSVLARKMFGYHGRKEPGESDLQANGVVVQEERFVTDWTLVDSYTQREVIDLVAQKQDVLTRNGGIAPPSPPGRGWWDVGTGGGEWVLSAGVGFIPLVGDVKDVQETIAGVDLITGEKLATWERVLTGVLIFVPFLSGSTVRGLVKGGEALAHAAKGAVKASDEFAEAVKGSGKLYHYTTASHEVVEKTLREGLRPGASGYVFTTPSGDLTPLQAQIDLALPPNRGLPRHLIEIDAERLAQLGVDIPEPLIVGRKFGLPGGGWEVLIDQTIPPETLRLVRDWE